MDSGILDSQMRAGMMSPGRAVCVGLQGISRSSCRTGHVGKAQRMVGASEAPELDAREKEGRQGGGRWDARGGCCFLWVRASPSLLCFLGLGH